ncbi:tripartite tricarboxylate transporter permease [Candidatus Micrarchaeota archaeon]|nr:tripartite tricarboxylate transporter permease [Candidatus Micrarchaeota archaeon]
MYELILGLALGFVSGLIPGLHSNTVISLLSETALPPDVLSLIIISLFSAHIVVSFVPSIFFGVPDETSVLSVLPGQRMVMKGEGERALKTVIFACIFSAVFASALFPVSSEIFTSLYPVLRPMFPYILIWASLFLLIKNKKPLSGLAVFLTSGILGYAVFQLGMPDPFLPLFSGLFAGAAAIRYKKGSAPPQKESTFCPFETVKYAFLGVFAGLISDMLPGISSPSQMALFLSFLLPITSAGYLATISAVSISQAVFSLSSAASIGKARTGAVAMLADIADISENSYLYLGFLLLSVLISSVLLYFLRKKLMSLAKIDFSYAGKILFFFLFALSVLVNGYLGGAVFIASTAVGLATLDAGVERTNLMSAIIVPSIIATASF